MCILSLFPTRCTPCHRHWCTDTRPLYSNQGNLRLMQDSMCHSFRTDTRSTLILTTQPPAVCVGVDATESQWSDVLPSRLQPLHCRSTEAARHRLNLTTTHWHRAAYSANAHALSKSNLHCRAFAIRLTDLASVGVS